MLVKRILASLVIIPILVALVAIGGWPLNLAIIIIFATAAWEYWRTFKIIGLQPSAILLIGGVSAICLAEVIFAARGRDTLLTLMVLIAVAYHVIQFERGNETAAANLAVTLSGLLYIGWAGAHLIALRNLPDGHWWILLLISTTALGDGGAYIVGMKFGRHQMSPRVSPNKSWEGYIGNIIFAVVGAVLLATLWHFRAPAITPINGLLLGLILGMITPMGDLGISLLKRQAGIKDTSHIIPGHGGILDRLDTWVWATFIGYYLINWFWLPP